MTTTPLAMLRLFPTEGLEIIFSTFGFDYNTLMSVKQLFNYKGFTFRKIYDEIEESPERITELATLVSNRDIFPYLFDVPKFFFNTKLGEAYFKSQPDYQIETTVLSWKLVEMLVGETSIMKLKSLDDVDLFLDGGEFDTAETMVKVMSKVMLVPVLHRIISTPYDDIGRLLLLYVDYENPDEEERLIRFLITELTIIWYHSDFKLADPRDMSNSIVEQFKSYYELDDVQKTQVHQLVQNANKTVESGKTLIALIKSISSKNQSVAYWMAFCSALKLLNLDPKTTKKELLWLTANIPMDKIVPLVFSKFLGKFSQILIENQPSFKERFLEEVFPLPLKSVQSRLGIYIEKGPFERILELDTNLDEFSHAKEKVYKELYRSHNLVVNLNILWEDPEAPENLSVRLYGDVVIDLANNLLTRSIVRDCKTKCFILDTEIIDLLISWPYLLLLQRKLPMQVLFEREVLTWKEWEEYLFANGCAAENIDINDLREEFQTILSAIEISQYFSLSELRSLIDSDFKEK